MGSDSLTSTGTGPIAQFVRLSLCHQQPIACLFHFSARRRQANSAQLNHE